MTILLWLKYHHTGRRLKGQAKQTISPLKPLYEMDVEIRPVGIYEHVCGGGL